MWLSLVEHLLGEQGVAGSNPATLTERFEVLEGQANGRLHSLGKGTRITPLRVRLPHLPLSVIPGSSVGSERDATNVEVGGSSPSRETVSFWKIKPIAGDGTGLENRRGEIPWWFDPTIFRSLPP